MRIVIAAGIYPPEVGGPALYAQGVEQAFIRMGHRVSIAVFSDLKRYPSGIRHFLYIVKLLFVTRHADAIFAFDTYSAGVPATFVGMIRRIPVVIRVGGDFVWEAYVERTKDLVPLPDFYRSPKRLNIKERLAFYLVRWMASRSVLAFNTPWLRSIWSTPYRVDTARTGVVENMIGARFASTGTDNKILLFGRNITLKNASAFKRALERTRSHGVNLELEEGMISREKLIDRIRGAYAVAVPSISDVAPNTVIDAIRCGKPFLITKHSAYATRFPECGIAVDPLSEDDMVRGIEELAREATYKALCARIAEFKDVRTYDDIARELLALL